DLAPEDEGHEGHDHVPHQRVHDLAQGRADDHADGEIHDVALHRELFEFRHHAHLMLPPGALFLQRWSRKNPAPVARAWSGRRVTLASTGPRIHRGAAPVARGLLGGGCKMLKSRVFPATGLNLSEANP